MGLNSAKYKRSKSLFCIEIDNLHRYTLFESGTMAAVSQINAKVFLLSLCSLRSTSKHVQAAEELSILFRLGQSEISKKGSKCRPCTCKFNRSSRRKSGYLRFEGNGKIENSFGEVGKKVCPVGCLSLVF